MSIQPLPLAEEAEPRPVELPEGTATLRPVALLPIPLPAGARVGADSEPPSSSEITLTLFWIEGYGGGLFLPFGDRTNGTDTYGGGRYLYDTIKGADLGGEGADAGRIVLDFNFAYNPSCAYSPRWVCPLAPPENRLPFRVSAGERYPAPARS